MKISISILLFLLFSLVSFGQDQRIFIDSDEFNTVFANLENGKFIGTTNGLLIIEDLNKKELLLDFQGSNAELNIIKDLDEVYDVSTKCYKGKTTSGQTEIVYETYATANKIGVKLDGMWYELSSIDGACDMKINGLKYSYNMEKSTEYLTIWIDKELVLNNWQYLIRTEHTMKQDNIKELEKKRKTIKIKPNSSLVFAIKR